MERFEFQAIGTHWRIEITDALAPSGRERLLSAIRERVESFEQTYSRFRPTSTVSDIARAAGAYRLPDDAGPMLDLYKKLYDLTDGSFTPLIGQVLVDAGYDPAYSLAPKTMTVPPTWDQALDWQRPDLIVKKPVQLDFGAAGKGYIVDLVGQLMSESGVRSFMINAGGDILCRDAEGKAQRIGLEHPERKDEVIGVASIANRSICGSAGNRRAWANFHHTIDPHTLMSPKHIRAIWTVAETTMLADALTTCLYFVSPDKLLQTFAFEYLIVRNDYSIERSPAFPAELFMA